MVKEWQFLNFSNVEEASNRRTRSAIRSHITRRQHRLARQKKLGQPADDLDVDDPVLASGSAARSDTTSPDQSPPTSRDATYNSINARPRLTSKRPKRTAKSSNKAIVTHRRKTASPDLVSPESTPPRQLTQISLTPSNGRSDPFNCYPVPWQPWFDRILHHMMTIFAPRAWPALKINNQQGLSWERFMTQMALSEPALYYVRLLFASGDLVRLDALPPEVPAWLQYQAVKSLNEALSDPERSKSDAVILAVGRIAFHESLYGDRDACNRLHRPAQARMIAMRGGMSALDFPPLVKRLMRLTDDAMARQSNTKRFLEAEDESQEFSLSERVQALESWKIPEATSPHYSSSDEDSATISTGCSPASISTIDTSRSE